MQLKIMRQRRLAVLAEVRTKPDLFERRQERDYIDFVSFQESQVLPWISKAVGNDTMKIAGMTV